MPENREVEDSAERLRDFIAAVPEKERIVRNIWVDLTEPDVAEVKRSHPASSGLVFALSPTSSFVRGTKSSKTPLYPTRYAASNGKATEIKAIRLALMAVHGTPRTIDMEFKDLRFNFPYWAQVLPSHLPGFVKLSPNADPTVDAHCGSNILSGRLGKRCCSCEQNGQSCLSLDMLFVLMHSQKRRFKVALAFELANYFISFNSQDFLFQVGNMIAITFCLTCSAHRIIRFIGRVPETIYLIITLTCTEISARFSRKWSTKSRLAVPIRGLRGTALLSCSYSPTNLFSLGPGSIPLPRYFTWQVRPLFITRGILLIVL